MVCMRGRRAFCNKIHFPVICLCLPTGCAIGSRYCFGMVRVYGFAPTDSFHTARLRRCGKLLYPFHPLCEQGDALEIVEVRSDMLVARLPDGSRRGIPAWMFDPAVCNEVRKLSRPII